VNLGWIGRRAWLLLCGAAMSVCVQAAAPEAGAGPSNVRQLAPGVYAVIGSVNGADMKNLGAVGNSGFIATPAGTVVINPGGSYRLGRTLLALAERTTGRPVISAVITQARPEYLMGTAAFTDRGIEVIAHEATARLILQRCHLCLQRLQRELGEDVMVGTRIVRPTRGIDGSIRLSPGGRPIDLVHLGPAQTDGDLAVMDVTSGVAFSGALVTRGRIPELDTVALTAPWRRALATLSALPVRTLVPGYGAPGPPAPLIAATDAYLARLGSEVQAQLEAGANLQAAQRRITMGDWRGWAQYEPVQARNVQRHFLASEAR
jgi:glyoxylase-like metal-dependent hydrolase (beta-lactamase superfamily II)